MRVSLEQKINILIEKGFEMNFKSIPENRPGKQYFGMFDNGEYVLPIVGKDFKDVVTQAFDLENEGKYQGVPYEKQN